MVAGDTPRRPIGGNEIRGTIQKHVCPRGSGCDAQRPDAGLRTLAAATLWWQGTHQQGRSDEASCPSLHTTIYTTSPQSQSLQRYLHYQTSLTLLAAMLEGRKSYSVHIRGHIKNIGCRPRDSSNHGTCVPEYGPHDQGRGQGMGRVLYDSRTQHYTECRAQSTKGKRALRSERNIFALQSVSNRSRRRARLHQSLRPGRHDNRITSRSTGAA